MFWYQTLHCMECNISVDYSGAWSRKSSWRSWQCGKQIEEQNNRLQKSGQVGSCELPDAWRRQASYLGRQKESISVLPLFTSCNYLIDHDIPVNKRQLIFWHSLTHRWLFEACYHENVCNSPVWLIFNRFAQYRQHNKHCRSWLLNLLLFDTALHHCKIH